VQSYRWITLADLHQELILKPERFTPWFKQALMIAEKGFDAR
jgi:hypothetical protein